MHFIWRFILFLPQNYSTITSGTVKTQDLSRQIGLLQTDIPKQQQPIAYNSKCGRYSVLMCKSSDCLLFTMMRYSILIGMYIIIWHLG